MPMCIIGFSFYLVCLMFVSICVSTLSQFCLKFVSILSKCCLNFVSMLAQFRLHFVSIVSQFYLHVGLHLVHVILICLSVLHCVFFDYVCLQFHLQINMFICLMFTYQHILISLMILEMVILLLLLKL